MTSGWIRRKTLLEAQSLAQLAASSLELREVWEAPSIPAEQKRALLDAIVARAGFSRPVRNFVAVLIDHRRIKFLDPIVKEFEQELNRRMGFIEAQITSARELGEPERSALESQVAKLTGQKVRARYSQDGSILGGAIVKSWQHDLRRLGKGPAGADKGSDQLLAFGF